MDEILVDLIDENDQNMSTRMFLKQVMDEMTMWWDSQESNLEGL